MFRVLGIYNFGCSLTVSKTLVRLIKKKGKMLSHYSLLLTKAKIISAICTNYSCNDTLFRKVSQSMYRISSYSFRGNYSFLNLTLCTVTFGNSTYRCGNYSGEETIQGRKLYEEIRYLQPN